MRFQSLLASLGFLVVGCGLLTGPDDQKEFERNLRRWESRGPSKYTFDFHRFGCECPPDFTIPLRITVEDREIQTVVNLRTGVLSAAETHQAMTVDELFLRIARALEQGAVHLSVVYDDELGYPTSISIDHDRKIADDEISYSVSALQVVP